MISSSRTNHQETMHACEPELPALGLKLKLTSSRMKQLRGFYSEKSKENYSRHKAIHFQISSLVIGDWKWESKHEGDTLAKYYFPKKKIVWEFLDGSLKWKMEIRTCDIIAMNAEFYDDPSRLDVWELEMNKPPTFFLEKDTQPLKHTNWKKCEDFTPNKASTNHRVHRLRFKPGELSEYYQMLLDADEHLLDLARKPFPKNEPSPNLQPDISPEILSPSSLPLLLDFSSENSPLVLGNYCVNQEPYRQMLPDNYPIVGQNGLILDPSIGYYNKTMSGAR